MTVQGSATRTTAEAVARRGFGRLVAILAKRTGDIAGAEDALADAFAAALATWDRDGVPDHPEAWLLTTARRRIEDGRRRKQVAERVMPHLALLADEVAVACRPEKDERLALMFACAHPAIDAGLRAPLILQTILGFDAATIASAFLIAPATMAQRLVRAKTKIRQTKIPFAIPDHADRPQRLDAVLAAIYAVFSEGWNDPIGTEPHRRDLATEAIWLGRVVVETLPDEPEAAGLLSLMLHAEARHDARRDGGRFIPLDRQDIAQWRMADIEEAENLLRKASTAARPGRYQLEAAIQSAHAVRRITGQADWPAIVALYETLLDLTGSPVVAVNRASAIGQTRGAEAGLAALDAVADERLADYQPFWATRAELGARAGRIDEAREAYSRAIGLERDPAVRLFLMERTKALS